MRKLHQIACILLIIVSLSVSTFAENSEIIKIGTYNIENFMKMFDQDRMPERSQDQAELWRDEEDQYEVARVIKDKRFNPDILVIQECCDEASLKMFNDKWLKDIYPYVKVFTSNTEGQYLGIMAKAGYQAIQVKEYYQDQDTVRDNRISNSKETYNKEGENKLFCRGPGFVLFKTPGGNSLWVGTTHSKSKSGNSKAVTEWRIRELERTREICEELIKAGTTPYVIILGDFNDSYGQDNYEKSIGRDAVAVMAEGKGAEQLTWLNLPMLQKNPDLASYHCEIKPKKYRSFLDHAFASSALAGTMTDIYLIDESIAYVASDHLPVICVFKLPGK